MGCNCGKGRDNALAGTTLRASAARPNHIGIYDTMSAPDCDTPYEGIFKAATLYIVDLNGEHEEFFVRAERQLAATKARKNKLTLAHLPAGQFCHDLMVELLEG